MAWGEIVPYMPLLLRMTLKIHTVLGFIIYNLAYKTEEVLQTKNEEIRNESTKEHIISGNPPYHHHGKKTVSKDAIIRERTLLLLAAIVHRFPY